MSYAQSVYLLFASVYVCKETVEHLLLSSGEEAADGHHHHHGHEDVFGCVFLPCFCSEPYLDLFQHRVPPIIAMYNIAFAHWFRYDV